MANSVRVEETQSRKWLVCVGGKYIGYKERGGMGWVDKEEEAHQYRTLDEMVQAVGLLVANGGLRLLDISITAKALESLVEPAPVVATAAKHVTDNVVSLFGRPSNRG